MRTTNMRSLSVGVGVLLALTIGCSIALKSIRPDLFPIKWAVPATFTFFAQFGLLGLSLTRKGKQVGEEQLSSVFEKPMLTKSTLQNLLSDLVCFGIFLLLGVIAGTISGGVWWTFGGHTIRTISEAPPGAPKLPTASSLTTSSTTATA